MTDKTNYERALDEIETVAALENMGMGEAAFHRENRANALATLALVDAVKEQTALLKSITRQINVEGDRVLEVKK